MRVDSQRAFFIDVCVAVWGVRLGVGLVWVVFMGYLPHCERYWVRRDVLCVFVSFRFGV